VVRFLLLSRSFVLTHQLSIQLQIVFSSNSEDGHIYRWNLLTNVIDQAVSLSPGIGQPYVPTVIGPDGTLYTLNGGNLFAVGAKPDVSMTIRSSKPDVRTALVGDSITFTATVSAAGGSPTGTVTFVDVTYNGLTPVTTTLASNVPLAPNGLGNGVATVPPFYTRRGWQ
jgi:uncharacterized repeat protein (TIGR01451 family)